MADTAPAGAGGASAVRVGGLRIHPRLAQLVEDTICPGTGFSPLYFWRSLEQVVKELTPELEYCLKIRAEMQEKIDVFYGERKAAGHNLGEPLHRPACREFLRSIGYWLPEGTPVSVTTQFVDPEIAQIPAPQLVVPSDNARFVLNAVNARWGSLFDALYGFDVIPNTSIQGPTKVESESAYNAVRGESVIAFANSLLDEIAPLVSGSWADAVRIWPRYIGSSEVLAVMLGGGETVGLQSPSQFVGSSGSLGPPTGRQKDSLRHTSNDYTNDKGRIFLNQNGLHLVLEIDFEDPIGRTNPSGMKDITMESALSTILDMEDSVAAVDADDKANIYSNINGVFRGTLEAPFMKNGKVLTRRMHDDIFFRDSSGSAKMLPGRAVALVRNVGHHMFTDAVVTEDGKAIPEGFLDCMVTVASALHDLKGQSRFYNSRVGSIYIVKPKMHGPWEVALTCKLFSRAEEQFGLRRDTIKMGIMDEERRTSVNLRECIRSASERVFFINTGFLDRTGDEIHTCMAAGPVVRKADMRAQSWIRSYEASNVDIGISAGLQGKGQIGKGMWAKPDSMRDMIEAKISELMAGASTAWVPSPTAATLHAIHYHRVDVVARQAQLGMRSPAKVEAILEPPLLLKPLSKEAIMHEVREGVQSILGYVVRWIDLGIGCSKVPDLSNVGLMEDRATLRISSQLLANWHYHGLVSEEELRQIFAEMAEVVDRQNALVKGYRPMSSNLEKSIAFQAALTLVLDGRNAPNGYTEFTLHDARREVKNTAMARL